MVSPAKKYTREMFDEYKMLATWTPDVRLALGDIGTLEGRRFVRKTSLKNLGVSFSALPGPEKGGIQRYSSKGEVQINFKAQGNVLPESKVVVAKVGAEVLFSSKGAVLFEASNCRTSMIDDVPAVMREVLKIYKAEKDDPAPRLEDGDVIITHLMAVDSLSVLVSNDSDAKVELNASGDVQAGRFPVTDATLGLACVYSRKMEAQITSEHGGTPLFMAMKIDDPWWRGPRTTPLKGKPGEGELNIGEETEAKQREARILNLQSEYLDLGE